jgi:hypothetical protein
MRSLTAQDILAVWEAGRDQHPVDRALTVLEYGFPDLKREHSARLPLGQRDGMLLRMRAATFGDMMTSFVRCPKCGEQLEFPISCSAISGPGGAISDQQSGASGRRSEAPKEFSLRHGKIQIRFRLLDSFDLAAAAAGANLDAARQELLKRCVLSAKQEKRKLSADELPKAVAARLAVRLAELDPLSELNLDLTCPKCRNQWQEVLDPLEFFWAELAEAAGRLLSEVHILAHAYGWRESEVLALSAQRRRRYLEMVGA